MRTMPPAFASASGTDPVLPALLEGIASRALADLGPGEPPDLAILFVTPDFGAEHGTAGDTIRARTGARHLLGCSGIGVIGADAEREGGTSAALLLARLPGTGLRPFHVVQDNFDAESDAPGPTLPSGNTTAALVLADPFTVNPDHLMAAGNVAWTGVPVLGGLASGARRPGVHVLWLDGKTYREGAVGFGLVGGVEVRPLVSQGCRPVGRRYVVTKAGENRIETLAGKPAAEALRATLEGLSPADQALARTSLHIGRVANESSDDFHRGDFLIRNLMSIDAGSGTLVVGDDVRVGQTVQFQLRDAATAKEDLAALLDREAAKGRPAAGLVFSCGGRGSRLFGEPDHDLRLVRAKLGAFPMAGFFCNGEIGPVGENVFLHGFTSSMALFR
jgi:small ligand-binding sensory domain FIST